MYHCDPPGRSDADSILCTPLDDAWQERNFVFCFDQEPLILDLHKSTFNSVDQRNTMVRTLDNNENSWVRHRGVVVTSELNSDNIDFICKQYELRPFYYFFHGWAALDWYRGYNRTHLITPINERLITKTFFSANRIIGGLRQHRVLMLYHFQRLGLMDNWISASDVCPVEKTHISEIAKQYQHIYPDIVDVINTIALPKLFPGEDQPKMSSCWLDQFEPCAESLLYHITETVYTGRRLHLTEKTFKPIALGMPFVMSGTAGSLKYLRSYGFKTFDGIWDESYDEETDDIRRAEQVASLLKSLDELPVEGKQDLFKMAIPIIEHNWKHFYNGGFEELLWHELENMLADIKEHFAPYGQSYNRLP
jgi:hypothetical protein